MAKPPSSQANRSLGQGRQRPVPAPEPEPDEAGDTLFIPQGDEDRTWDPPIYEQDDGEEMLGWDASNDNSAASVHRTFRDSGSAARQQQSAQQTDASQEGLEPTQRLSQVSITLLLVVDRR